MHPHLGGVGGVEESADRRPAYACGVKRCISSGLADPSFTPPATSRARFGASYARSQNHQEKPSCLRGTHSYIPVLITRRLRPKLIDRNSSRPGVEIHAGEQTHFLSALGSIATLWVGILHYLKIAFKQGLQDEECGSHISPSRL